MKFYNLIFNQTTDEAGFLPKGWSTIAMQRCSSAWSSSLSSSQLPCLLPPSPPLSRGCGESSMRGNEKRGSSVSLLGQLCCSAVLSFFCLLLSLFLLLTYSIHLSLSRCSSSFLFILSSFHLSAVLSCLQGHWQRTHIPLALCENVNALAELSLPEFPFISEINCFSMWPHSNNRSSCTVRFWSKLKPFLH